MDKSERRRRVRRDRLVDIGVAAWGAAPTAFGEVDVDRIRDPEKVITGPASKLVTGTKKGWQSTQEELGKGSRRAGFDRASELIQELSGANGKPSRDSAEGARDALLQAGLTSSSQDYRRAYRSTLQLQKHVPIEHATYPRTEDGFHGGVIAAVAITYADVTGDPMLSRVQRAVAKTRTAKWSPGNVVFGSGASLSGSILDAVKHITESATDDADSAANQVDEAKEAIEKWRSLLGQLGTMADTRGPDEATSAAKKASNQAEDAARLARDASQELKVWEREL